MIAICTGTLLVGIDYVHRVQLLLVFMFPKSVEVLVNMLVQRNLMTAKVREYLIQVVYTISLGVLAVAAGIEKQKPEKNLTGLLQSTIK